MNISISFNIRCTKEITSNFLYLPTGTISILSLIFSFPVANVFYSAYFERAFWIHIYKASGCPIRI